MSPNSDLHPVSVPSCGYIWDISPSLTAISSPGGAPLANTKPSLRMQKRHFPAAMPELSQPNRNDHFSSQQKDRTCGWTLVGHRTLSVFVSANRSFIGAENTSKTERNTISAPKKHTPEHTDTQQVWFLSSLCYKLSPLHQY